MTFFDRREAGARLARELLRRRYRDPVVLALPRGGVPVAAEIANVLHAPLDVLVVRKLGCPGNPELGVGAVVEDGLRLVNHRLVSQLGISPVEIDRAAALEGAEVSRRVRRYRGERAPVALEDRVVILVDDGLATGFTARAAIDIARRRGARRVVLAVPVGPAATVDELRTAADDVVCLEVPSYFLSIGQWYTDFRQVSDDTVSEILRRHEPVDEARGQPAAPGAPSVPPG